MTMKSWTSFLCPQIISVNIWSWIISDELYDPFYVLFSVALQLQKQVLIYIRSLKESWKEAVKLRKGLYIPDGL